MPIWSLSTFTRCAVVPAEGDPILFEHGNSMHHSATRAKDVRRMHLWEFFDDPAAEARVFAREAVAALRELGVQGNRIGVDRLGMPAVLALQDEGLVLVDSSPATQEARQVKTSQEVAASSGGTCSQTRTTIQPTARSRSLTSSSQRTLQSSLAAQ